MKGQRVAVIGAGAAGLASARELQREQHEVVVFEQSQEVGGVWVYSEEPEDDPLGSTPGKVVFSSLYESLRTNLPSDLMAFTDYSFGGDGGGDDAWPRYPSHEKVLQYLQNFAVDHGLLDVIRFGETVNHVQPEGTGFSVQTSGGTKQFDALVVGNGHYSKPRLPAPEFRNRFRGLQLHAHNYRKPQLFAGQRVLVLGTGASGSDIAREIAGRAKEVIWSGPAFERPTQIKRNFCGYPAATGLGIDTVDFNGLESKVVDTVLYCTGYLYDFPFLEEDIVAVRDNHVRSLYMHMVPPDYPTCAFVGLPFLIVPFPFFERQARWFARSLSGRMSLPDKDIQLRWLEQHREWLKQNGVASRHAHKLGDLQTAYLNELAQQCDDEPVPDWFTKLSQEAQASRLAHPADFRDRVLRTRAPKIA